MIIYNCPSIPDRTAYILGKSNANPVVPIIKIGKKLKDRMWIVYLFRALQHIIFMMK